MGTGCMDADWSGFHYLMERHIDTFFFPCLNALFLYLSIKFDPIDKKKVHVNPFAPGDFAKKCVLTVLEWFSGHCPAIKS